MNNEQFKKLIKKKDAAEKATSTCLQVIKEKVATNETEEGFLSS